MMTRCYYSGLRRIMMRVRCRNKQCQQWVELTSYCSRCGTKHADHGYDISELISQDTAHNDLYFKYVISYVISSSILISSPLFIAIWVFNISSGLFIFWFLCIIITLLVYWSFLPGRITKYHLEPTFRELYNNPDIRL